MIYRTRDKQLSYGRPIGIIALEERIPCPPGTPGNPTTFPFPVCYEIARGVGTDALRQQPAQGFDGLLEAGRRLVERGACAVAGGCGLMIAHQEALADALPVPVLTSSLLQVPLVARMLGRDAAIGVLVSGEKSLSSQLPQKACTGIRADVVFASMEGKPYFNAAVRDERGELDFEGVTAEVVDVVETLVTRHPQVKALIFECVDLPPYAHAVQQAVGLPVFDITTLIGYFHSALVRPTFKGVY